MSLSRSLPALLLLAVPLTASAADWKPAPAPLMTKWGKAVTPDNVWKEYPRPQLVRKEWQNLNGLWDYAITPKGAAKPEKWDGRILVPFAVEAALSGVGKSVTPEQNLWYHRTVEVPAGWKGERVLLHFGAVDFEATVWVNGKELGTHRGMSDPFSFDVTDALKDGKGEVVVRVWDPTDTESQPRGKQVMKPGGIWYTPVTGIWQTVWMEPVNRTHVTRVVFTPDVDKGEVECVVDVADARPDRDSVRVWFGPVASSTPVGYGTPGKPFRVKLKEVKLWTPDTPHLVPVTINLDRRHPGDMQEALDWGTSYFAMRKVSAGKDENGVLRLMLNNKPLFQVGPLDQGWWPDGLLTPPSEDAMRYDLDVLKKLGFNMLRKHIKVEPAGLYAHCDKIGLLVWQDMPSGFVERTQFVQPNDKADATFTDADKKQFRAELKAEIDHLRFFPCIYCWVPFNEGWGQHDTNDILRWTKEYDPTRLVNGPSGWTDRGYGDMKDMHNYPGPGMFPVMPDRVSVLGEFGGLGLPVKGHLWKDTKENWGYRTLRNTDELRAGYRQLVGRLHPLIGKGLAAAVYTQTTDVEVEVNGLMTYDREVLKFDPAETAGWHKALFGPPPTFNDLVPTSRQTAQAWKYTTDKPADGWEAAGFDAAGWKDGPGVLGSKGTPGANVRTEWTTPDIWARRTFELAALPKGEPMLLVLHDEDAEIYVNGVLAARVAGHTGEYVEVPMTEAGRKALKVGANVVAVHCHQTRGGQSIDVGFVEVVPGK